jgi:uncharacterized repeat protein (TIGR01451 family)
VTRCSLSARRQVFSQIFSKIQFAITVILLLVSSGVASHLFAQQQIVARGPKIWLGDNQALPVVPVGPTTLAQNVAAGKAQPLSMTAADVDGDGVSDMIAGFSAPGGGSLVIHRGNVDAFAPQSAASFQAIGRGQFPSPFLPNAQVIDIPVRPDFVAVGNFTASGHQDLIVAARGGNALLVLAGDGKGNFAASQTINLSGSITALGAEHLAGGQPFFNLVVGISTPKDAALLVFTGSNDGLSAPLSIPQSAAVSSIAFGDFGEANTDTAFLAGGDVFILHTSTMQVEALNLPVNASALALGSFIYDRNPHQQIALLTSDGSVHIAAHSEFDPHTFSIDEMQTIRHAIRNGEQNALVPQRGVAVNGWKIVETIPAVAPFNAGQLPQFFRTRISDHGSDDVMVINPSVGQLSVISHPDVAPDTPAFAPAQISTRPYAGSPNAALAMRTNIDGRPGVVAMHAGQLAPAVMQPLPDPTFFVNRTDDPAPTAPIANACNNVSNVDVSSSCSIREAVLRANAVAGTDTIQLAAGTFTLTRPKVVGDFSGNNGALYINDSVNIVGAGQATTIIQAGTTAANGVDMVMAVNEDISPITNATASLSNLTLKFGRNTGTHGNDGDGGCMEFDTGSSGNANLTLTSVTLDTCSTLLGNGAGIAIFNFTVPNNGLVTFTNSIVQNNSAVDATSGVGAGGGGIWVSQGARASLTNTQLLNNNATEVNTGLGIGGGIFLFTNTPNSRQTVISGGVISGNKSAGFGGGVHNLVNLSITGTVISGNIAGTNGSTPIAGQDGGGLYLNTSANGCPAACTDTTSLSKVTITGNTASALGGGVAIGNGTGAGSVTMTFSRLAGNIAPSGNNLSNSHTTVSATNDWWGTNTPTNTIADTATTTTSTPFIKMTHVASPSTIRINQSTTLTADLSKDNNGSGAALAGNLNVLNGLPITFNNPIKGTIPDAQPEALSALAQATATFNAGAVSGNGSADATVDQQTVTAPIVILEPLRIIKSFVPATVAVNAASALTFSVNNPNVIAVDASFTDTLPAGLVVAATPTITNTCGGTVTAVAGAGSVSFSNASLPVGACTISVHVSSATDNVYANSVTINSTAAGTGALSTSSANLTVINPPTIAKAFGAATIPLNGTTSLSFNIHSTNVNLTLSGIAFTDNLPAGLVVASPSNLTSSCGGTATATAGSSSVSLSGGTLTPLASCTVSVNVQGTTAGVKNNSVQVSDTVAGTGNTSNASITVVAPPVIIKAFGAASIPLNGSTSLTFTIQNNNTTVGLTGVGFSDTLPAGLVVSTPNGLTGSCGGGTITATAGGSVISLSGASLAASTSCTFAVNVTGTAAGQQNNTTGNVTSIEGGTGGTASASINVVAPPSIAKVFNPPTIALNATTSLTFTITNPAANAVALTGVAFTDTLPTGLTVANASATICGGTLTTTAPTGIALTGATIAVNSQCQFSVTVTGAVSGQYTNTTGAVTSTNGGTGNTATANLTVATPPTITKAFGAATIPLNGSTSLTFNITNPNAGLALTGLAFTDNLPAGLVVAATPNVSNTCGGTVTAVAGASSISLSAGTVAASGSCTVSVSITGTTAGVKNNSVQVTSTEGGTGNTSNASITVIAPPVIIKAFGAASIPLNGSTSLTFTIQNNNTTVALSGVAFSDTLPAGLVVSTPNGLTGTCGAGTITATAGSGVISLTGGTIAASASCTFAVNVTGTAVGQQNNTTGQVTSTEGGTGGTASASINVVVPPSIAKAFNPSAIALNATTSLTFTITNPAANAVALTGVAFTDTLPTGLTVANASATVCGGTLTTTAPTGIALTGATIAVNSQCQFSITVTGAAAGQYTNTTGAVTSTNGGTGNTATANLTVATPPTIAKAFGAAAIPLNGSTSLTFNITNPNTTLALTGVAFTDNLPAGLVVAATPNVSNTCGGTVTAVGGAGSISLSGGTVAASGNCTVSVSITGTTAGVKNNSVQVTSTEGGTGNTSNASITVIAPPVIIKAFGAASIPLNGSTSLTFTIQNNNATVGLTGVGFSDTLPAGLVVSTPNGLTGSCGGGTITATAGSGVISLSGASLAASTSCTFSINVTGATAGNKNNTTGQVTSTEGGTGGTASASINVVAPPSIAKAFNPSAIALNATTSLTFTITNPAANAVALTGVAFTDTLPTGLTVANASATVCGGTLTTTAPTGIALTGATIAANSQCQFSITVTGAAAGQYTNTTGAVTSTNGGTGNTATANFSVATPPTITKAFGAAAIPLGGSTSLSFTINNPNASLSLTGVAFTDNLPAGLVVSTPNGLTGSCGGGTITAVAGATSVSLSGATLAATASCSFSVNITATSGGVKNNSVQVTAAESGPGNTSNASIIVTSPPVIIKAFGAASIPLNGSTSLQFTIQNNNAATSLSGVAFSDTLPAGLVVSTPNGLTGACGGGTITAVAGSGSVSLSGGTLPSSSSCNFSVNVTGTSAGTKNNTTGQVTSVEGGTGGTASASIAVVAPPSIAKAFNPTAIGVNGTSTLTFTITNPAANTVAEAGVAFTDTLPAGLVVATPNGLANSCGGTATATAGSGSISLTGGTIAAASSCTLSASVTGASTGTFNNTSGAVSSTNGGTGNTASATLTIAPADMTITKTHNGTFHRQQTGAQYFITVSNSGAGPTVGTVTAVDNLPVIGNPHNIVPTDISGTGWTCTLATLTCTRTDVLAPGSSYPVITMTVDIPQNITNNFTNTATVSGGGETNTGNNTASDPVSLGPPIKLTPHSTSSSVKAGAPATFVFDVEDDDSTLGMVAFGCSGLPVGTACVFNPPATNLPLSQVTMTLTTSGNSSNVITSQRFGGPNPRLYAAFVFPALGLVAIVFSGRRKSKKTRLRLAFAFAGMITLLALAGCGGGNHISTPAGNFTITVTGATTTVQATTQVTLTVQ